MNSKGISFRVVVASLFLAAFTFITLAADTTTGKTKASGADKNASTAKVDINTASEAELQTLPGVGKSTVKKIISHRPYASVSDLKKAGVSAKSIQKIEPLASAGAASSRISEPAGAAPTTSRSHSANADATGKKASTAKVDLNTASEAELQTLPGVGKSTAKKIMSNRPYASVSDLKKAGVSAKTIQKIEPLASAGTASSRISEPAGAAPTTSRSHSANADAAAADKGMVWANTDSKVFHRPGDPWYGKTKQGAYMTEKEAISAGYHESKQSGEK